MTHLEDLLRAATRRVRSSVLLPLAGGNLLVTAASVLALLIPDSHVWQLLLSFFLVLGLVSGLLFWNATALRRLRSSQHSIPLWAAALILGGWIIIALVLCHLTGLASANVETRAGFWNSQMSPGIRHLFPYARLVALQEFGIEAIQWFFVPALLLPFVVESVSFGASRTALARAARVASSVEHWGFALVGLALVKWLAGSLVVWHPAHTVTGETTSAVLRLGFSAVLILCGSMLLLAVDAELLHRKEHAEASSSFEH